MEPLLRRRRKGIAEIENGPMELPVGGQEEDNEPFQDLRGDQDDRTGWRRRTRAGRAAAEQVCDVTPQSAATEQPNSLSHAS